MSRLGDALNGYTNMVQTDIVIRDMREQDIKYALTVIASHHPDHAVMAERDFKRHFEDDDSPVTYIVAELENRVVGTFGYYEDPDEDTKGIYWLVWLYVDKTQRQRGIGSTLMKHVEDTLKRRGVRKIYLDIGNRLDQPEAYQFYEQRNFVIEAVYKDYFSEGEDKVIFGKRLV
jgi:GNAT superfamily N-acetyltransferase